MNVRFYKSLCPILRFQNAIRNPRRNREGCVWTDSCHNIVRESPYSELSLTEDDPLTSPWAPTNLNSCEKGRNRSLIRWARKHGGARKQSNFRSCNFNGFAKEGALNIVAQFKWYEQLLLLLHNCRVVLPWLHAHPLWPSNLWVCYMNCCQFRQHSKLSFINWIQH